MPNYEQSIDPDEISSAIGSTKVQMNELARSLDQVRARLDSMTTLFGKQRDYTREEIREMQSFKREVEGVADAERKRDADRVKGMSSYSIYMERIEKQMEDYKRSALDAESKIKQAREQNAKLEQSRQGRFSKEKNEQMRIELKTTETNGAKLKRQAQDRIDSNKKIIDQNKELLNRSKKEVELLDDQYKKSVKIKEVGEEKSLRGGGRGRGISALEVASDLNLPGISHAAMVAKYAQRGAQGAEEGGGGMMSKLMGGGMGLMRGLGIAAGGYTALEGYHAYRTAEQMAPMARTLGGQMGPRSVAGRQRAVEAYGGYGGVENLQTLMGLNRAIGGGSGLGNLKGVTDIANRYGMSREEATGQLGGAFQSGMSPSTSSRDMEKIMSEGVKAGMDRARITQFTQEVLGVQQELFRSTGQNNAEAIAKAMGQLMRASGQGEQFLRGPGAQAVRGLNQSVMAAGRGQLQGQGAATLFRAFGFGAGGAGGGTEEYYNARKKMEGGIFGKGLGGDAVKNIGKILGRYDIETGGNKKAANLRMSDELGIGINQIESLRGIQSKAAKGQPLSKEDIKKLQEIQEEQKDPMLRILDINSKMQANLAKLAGSKGGIDAVIAIDGAMLKAQEKALGFLQSIANALTGNSQKGGGMLGMGDTATAALGAAGLGALMFPGTTGRVAKGAAGMGGKLLTKGAGLIPGVGGALSTGVGELAAGGAAGIGTLAAGGGAAGIGGYAAGKYVANPLLDKYTTETNKYGQKSNMAERAIARVQTMNPFSNYTSQQYHDTYDQAPDKGGGGKDSENTAATTDNTEAINRLTDTIAKQRGSRAANVGGSFR
jgi:hypothetical protein